MKKISLVLLLSLFLTMPQYVSAQTVSREQLQKELAELEAEVKKQQSLLDGKKTEGASLSRDISILQTKIKKTETEIKARDKSIQNINYSITDKNKRINTLDKKLETEAISMEATFRNYQSMQDFSLTEIALSGESLSKVFDKAKGYSDIKDALYSSIQKIKDTKTDLEEAKNDLLDTKAEEQALKQQQLLQKQEIVETKSEKDNLLKKTKGEEKIYQNLVAENQKRIAAIRSALFNLSGSKSINFGQAYDLALQVQKLTGVRAAFLLGIIRVESNLGQNVGTGNWKTDMHPTRDQPIFETMMAELGLDPDKQPVSKKAWYGYGGAMGPAQFIPSTWVSYKARISAVTGNNPPNPWNNLDAFTASGLLLADNGATKGTRTAEHRAAVCYLAGCGNASKTSYQFYGNDVMKYADEYEESIKILQNGK
jgi:membrane-bound lytic murein transglycosylase B